MNFLGNIVWIIMGGLVTALMYWLVGLKKVLQSSTYKNISVFIGPEGGFDESEVEKARAKGVFTFLCSRITYSAK